MIPLGNYEAQILVHWYEKNGRDYPWTGLIDPWAIWVSEVMLQQTTVATVGTRFPVWMEKYPHPAVLAETDEEEVLRDWEGLGYYNRARNLASAAAEVGSRFGGRIPDNSAELKSLPGVGDYIAAAVSSFAFDESIAAIEANGRRIAMRLAAEETWSPFLEKELRRKLETAMTSVPSAVLNAAVMQLGQQVCTPGKPSCTACPFSPVCQSFISGRQNEIPVGRKKKIVRKESRRAICMLEGKVFISRKTRGIGKGLWLFPRVEELGATINGREPDYALSPQTHTYTRFREILHPSVFLLESEPCSFPVEGAWISISEINKKPMPTAYRRIAEELT